MTQTLIQQNMVSGLVTDLGNKANASATGLKSGTPITTTSGTEALFSSIPAGVKRITVMLAGVSKSGTSNLLLQLGTSGGIVSTGYVAYSAQLTGSTITGQSYTAGFGVFSALATQILGGALVLTRLTGNVWSVSGFLADGSSGTFGWMVGGSVTLGAELDRVRLTMVNGTDTFDAGQANIMWEF